MSEQDATPAEPTWLEELKEYREKIQVAQETHSEALRDYQQNDNHAVGPKLAAEAYRLAIRVLDLQSESKLPWTRAITSPIRGWKRMWLWLWLQNTKHPVAEALILACLLFSAVSAVVEVSERQQLMMVLDSHKDRIQEDYVAAVSNGNGPSIRQPQSGASGVSATAQSAQAAPTYIAALENGLSDLQVLRSQLQSHIAVGSNHAISYFYEELNRITEAIIQSKNQSGASASGKSTSTSWISSWLSSYLGVYLTLSVFGSDTLLALVLVSCGGVGALIAGLRVVDVRVQLRGLLLGATAGFIAFLAIKGGKHIFLLQSGVTTASFNPYTSAFVGLVTGLFTERLHTLLGNLVASVTKKVEAAMDVEDATNGNGDADEPIGAPEADAASPPTTPEGDGNDGDS